ncbi:MAG: hypothetical protein LBE35_06730 [Clostridiales bacterium]|jgi:hypothetical protein|nr:hypothetical protein [Clostridiales bacterium]
MKRIWALLIALVLILVVVIVSTPSISDGDYYGSGYSSYHFGLTDTG